MLLGFGSGGKAFAVPTDTAINIYSVIVVWSTLKNCSNAGNPIVNINNVRPANNAKATIDFITLPPGSLFQIHEYMAIAPDHFQLLLPRLALDPLATLQLALPTKSNDELNPNEDDT